MEKMVMEKLEKDEFKWIYFMRQMFVASGAWCLFFCIGIIYGTPPVSVAQLRKTQNVTGIVTDDMASWLSCAFSYASIPWIFVLPYLSRTIGRKKTIFIISLSTISGFVVYSFSSTPLHLLLTEISFGLTQAGILTIIIVVISEYTSPEYRGIFLCIKTATGFWGIWVANAIGTYAHWYYISLCGLISSIYTLSVIFWPESPYYLAGKNLDECRKVHRWLKGTGEDAERELEKLIQSQRIQSVTNWKALKLKECYMPLLISLIIICLYHLSAKFVITIYAIDILKKMIADEAKAYRSMLILDGITVFSAYVGCYCTKIFKRRAILLTTSTSAILFLFSLSIYMYLIRFSVLTENVYVSICLLAGFSWSISSGPVILATSLYGELIPSRFKSLTVIVIALSFVILHGSLLKLFPLLFKALSLEGTFLFYAVGSSICLFLLYLYLPETKDKTLLEIEEYFKGGVKDESKKLISQNKV